MCSITPAPTSRLGPTYKKCACLNSMNPASWLDTTAMAEQSYAFPCRTAAEDPPFDVETMVVQIEQGTYRMEPAR